MNLKFLFITLFVYLILLGAGCSNQFEPNKEDEYREIKAIAWDFIQEKGWNRNAKEDWQNATVTKIVVDDDYELLDQTYEDKAVLKVSFEDIENAVIGTPSILVDPNNNEVVGYMPNE